MSNNPTDLGGGVKLSLALAALRGEVSHKVFVGIAEDVIAFCTVCREIERLILEDSNEVGEPVYHLLAAAELGGIVEVRHVGQLVGVGKRTDDFFVDLVANVALAFERNHVFEAGAGRNGDRRIGLIGVFIADVFYEQEDKDVILVLAGIHATTQFIATGPKGRIKF